MDLLWAILWRYAFISFLIGSQLSIGGVEFSCKIPWVARTLRWFCLFHLALWAGCALSLGVYVCQGFLS